MVAADKIADKIQKMKLPHTKRKKKKKFYI